MRQIASSGSAKAIWLDKNQLLEELKTAAKEAKDTFPEIKEIRLFGSLARNEETGLSDVDIFIVAETEIKNPIERIKPYFCFFSKRLKMSLDLIVARPEDLPYYEEMLKDSLPLV
ncbi:MAG: nucleotidyltransferase domain-containing protein [Candidatus Saccharicenans sp.]|nr:nucleotidyltransferase domain-containing protein [Candidatus Saccharicenans sp.]HOT69459.1 nucleotidyltransferase domain-containing protein [Candidatus Saccharicenans sp.]HQH61862.1 nucleotidyltransferase domain-containing protein [Candidatus Saccharicenans sp.]HUM35023.1 nucleotidyltransferase domain-containing protein [Candidatus Saccharicenans sp.]